MRIWARLSVIVTSNPGPLFHCMIRVLFKLLTLPADEPPEVELHAASLRADRVHFEEHRSPDAEHPRVQAECYRELAAAKTASGLRSERAGNGCGPARLAEETDSSQYQCFEGYLPSRPSL